METPRRKKIMGENDFRNTIVALLLFVAFTWLIISVAVDFGAEYGRDASEIGEGSLSVVSFQQTAENVSSSTQGYRERFDRSSDLDNVDDVQGIFSILTDLKNVIISPFTLLGQILTNVFHIPSLIINIFLGLLVIGLLLAIWRVLRAGS